MRKVGVFLIAPGAGLLITTLVILGFAQLMSSGVMELSVKAAAPIAVLLGSAVCAVCASRAFGKNLLVVSLLSGALFFALLLLVGALVFGRFAPESPIWGVALMSMLGGGISALLSLIRKPKRRKHR